MWYTVAISRTNRYNGDNKSTNNNNNSNGINRDTDAERVSFLKEDRGPVKSVVAVGFLQQGVPSCGQAWVCGNVVVQGGVVSGTRV